MPRRPGTGPASGGSCGGYPGWRRRRPRYYPEPSAVAADIRRRLQRAAARGRFLGPGTRRRDAGDPRARRHGSGLVAQPRPAVQHGRPVLRARDRVRRRASSCGSATDSTAPPPSRACASRQLPDRQRQRRQHRPGHARPRRAPPAGVRPGTSSGEQPAAAAGGVDPEDMEHIRQFAPFAYQTQERCVTEADYGQAASSITGCAPRRAARCGGPGAGTPRSSRSSRPRPDHRSLDRDTQRD